MKKEDLIALGLDDQQAAEVLKMRGQELGELKSLRADNDKLNDELAALRAESSSFKEITEELAATKASLAEVQAELKQSALDNALGDLLRSSGARDNDVIKALLDSSSISLNDKGELEGVDDQLTNLKESKPYLFKADKPDIQGTNPKKGAAVKVTIDDAITDPSVNLTDLITKNSGGN